MRVFVAGATGAIGRRLLPELIAAGHEVVAMTRLPQEEGRLLELGAEPVVADGLDRAAVHEAVARAEPEVVVHEMTGLRGVRSFKRFDREFALTNRLRTMGTDILLAAARAAGARRFVAQSYGNWNYERDGRPVKTEADPFDRDPPAQQRESIAALRHLESAVLGGDGIEGLALRYGNLYGPGTSIAVDGEIGEIVRRGRLPIVGGGTGIWSFAHVEDVAAATAAAVVQGEPGAYNVADDEPVAVADWLPELARALDAPPPRRVPAWVGRLATGEVGVSMMTRIRGASNAKAKRELGWQPSFPSYRVGFHRGLGQLAEPVDHPAGGDRALG
jgi:nucleoside-diphosphate-sugar epimerase